MATRYWKGQNLHGSDKYILRLLPDELGSLLLQYLVYIRPCNIYVATALHVHSDPSERKTAIEAATYYLFVKNDRRIKSEEVRCTFIKFWRILAGYTLTFQDMRHIMQAFLMSNAFKYSTVGDSDLVPDDNSDHFDQSAEWEFREHSVAQNCAMAGQAAHTADVAERFYGVSTERIKIVMAQQLLHNSKTSLVWHALLYANIDKVLFPAHKKSANLSLQIATRSVYASDKSPVNAAGQAFNVNVTQTFHTTSYHQPNPTSSNSSSSSGGSSSDGGILTKQGSAAIKWETRDLVQQQLLLHSANTGFSDFKSQQQKDGLCRLLERERDVMVILPTGGGKSLLFQLAALIEATHSAGKITIVVAPLAALKRNIYDECFRHNIPCETWSRRNSGKIAPGQFSGLVVTAAESFAMSEFQDFLASCALGDYLQRVVIDEAHLYLLWSDFRQSLDNIRHGVEHLPQLVLLSATVPPQIELELYNKFRLQHVTTLDQVDVIRATT
ncbi:hypothetical protein GGI24_004587, partial [Coemansia furcata]